MVQWEEKPEPDRITEEQFRTHFEKAYDRYLNQEDELSTAGIANNAMLQTAIQQQQDAMNALQQRVTEQEETNSLLTAKLKNLSTPQKSCSNDSVISDLTAFSTMQSDMQQLKAMIGQLKPTCSLATTQAHIRPEKEDPHRVRITAGGDRLDYFGETSTETASIETAKILINSV